MKRPPVAFIRELVKQFGFSCDVYLSGGKTVVDEPKDEERANLLVRRLHEFGYLTIPSGYGTFSVEEKENEPSGFRWSELSAEEINKKVDKAITQYMKKSTQDKRKKNRKKKNKCLTFLKKFAIMKIWR